MTSLMGERARFGLGDVAIYAVGVAGLAMSLTFVFLGMRAVMNIGGFCADGGPYTIATHCPDGVPLLMILGIFGLFVFGALVAWKGSVIGDPYGALVLLAWPALFISLGWNFLEYAFHPPEDFGRGVVWGWLIPGVIFVLMGGLPLLALLPFGHTGRTGAVRAKAASRIAPRPSPVLDAERAAMATVMTELLDKKGAEVAPARQFRAPRAESELVSELERLAALHRSGDLSYDEFEQAKRALLGPTGAAS